MTDSSGVEHGSHFSNDCIDSLSTFFCHDLGPVLDILNQARGERVGINGLQKNVRQKKFEKFKFFCLEKTLRNWIVHAKNKEYDKC